jgi:hypothetical protein
MTLRFYHKPSHQLRAGERRWSEVALSLLVGPKLSESRALTAELGNSDGAS